MDYRAWFQCINCDGEQYPLNEIIYECKKCGGLLEVQHDLDILRQTPAKDWVKRFDDRFMSTQYPFGSSVWGKKELVCPAVEDDNVVSMFEGGSNLFWADRLGQEIGLEDLWIKQCGNSHTGSFKDLGMTVLVSMVKQMITEGIHIPAVACASTGDTSAALAAYAAAAGIPAIVFLPKDKVSRSQLIQPIANGAITLQIETDFDGCMQLVRRICQNENIYLANSMNSLRIEGQKTIGIELIQQQDTWDNIPDWIIIPGGNLGNVSALGKGLLEIKEMGLINRLPRIAVAQAENANPLYRSYIDHFETFEPIKAQRTLANAIQIGDPVSYPRAVRMLKKFSGVVEQASENELANAAARADRTGLFTCPHTGVALAALFKLVDKKIIAPDDKVVVISTAHGLKFPTFKTDYHADALGEIGVEAQNKNPHQFVSVGDDYDKVRDVVLKSLDKSSVG
jgi:threonine synthase